MQEEVENRFNSFENKIRNSFVLIKEDIAKVKSKLDSFREYMNEWDEKMNNTQKRNEEAKIALEDTLKEFSLKINKASELLSSITSIKKNILLKENINDLEKNLRDSLRKELESHKIEIITIRAALSNLNDRIDNLENKKTKKEKVLSSRKLNDSKKEKKRWSFVSNFKDF
jgi:chromosome segregation ATPase